MAVGRMHWVAAVLVLAVAVVSGVEASPLSANATRSVENERSLADLVNGGRMASAAEVEDCVDRIRQMRAKHGERLDLSFPRNSAFVPPGSQEWCECILKDLVPGEVAVGDEMLDAEFNRCRAEVLQGSEINVVDICRGMFSLFGVGLNFNRATFCGELCMMEPEDQLYDLWDTPELNFNPGCELPCAREAMPGYCSKYLLHYSPFVSYMKAEAEDAFRSVSVEGLGVATQSEMRFQEYRLRVAQSICDALTPLLPDGNMNECCNYERGFSALSPCCHLDEDGKSVFDCTPNGGRKLYYACTEQAFSSFGMPVVSFWENACDMLVKIYESSEEYRGTVKLYEDENGKTVATFPDSIVAELCTRLERGFDASEGCCYSAFYMRFVNNCSGLGREYIGIAEPLQALEEPTMAAPVEDDGGEEDGEDKDPCYGLCSGERSCVLSENGNAFCAECAALVKERADGSYAECCEFDPEVQMCMTVLLNKKPGICRRNEPIFFMNADGELEPATFKRDAGFACGSPRDFRKMGLACKIFKDKNGVPKCYENSEGS